MSFGGGGSYPQQPPPPPTTVPMRQLTEVKSSDPTKIRSFMDAGAAAALTSGAQDPTKPFGSTVLGG